MRTKTFIALSLLVVLALLVPGGAQPIAAGQPQLAFSPAVAFARDERADPLQGLATATAQNVELVGQVGGAAWAVAVQGNYAYAAIGPRLVILNISDPANPTAVGRTDVLLGAAGSDSIEIAGNYYYNETSHENETSLMKTRL